MSDRLLERLLVTVPNTELPPSFRTQLPTAKGAAARADGGKGGRGDGKGPGIVSSLSLIHI